MADKFQNQSDAYIAWLKENGAEISDSIKLADLREQGRGRGVVATKQIDADEDLFSIPRSLILLPETSSLSQQATYALRDQLEGDEWSLAILTLMQESLHHKKSRWKPYLDINPTTFDTPMFWTESELDELEGSAILSRIGKDSAEKHFHDTLLPLIRTHILHTGDDNHHNLRSGDTISDADLLSLYHRSASTIMAYAFDVQPTPSTTGGTDADEEGYTSDPEDAALPKAMVPLADALNADAPPHHVNARLFHEPDRLVMRAVKKVDAGEELMNDYGALSRSELLRRYGYVGANYARYDDFVVARGREEVWDFLGDVGVGSTEKERSGSKEKVRERLKWVDGLEDGEEELEFEVGYGDLAMSWPEDEDLGDVKWVLEAVSEGLSALLAVLVMPEKRFEKLKKGKGGPPSLDKLLGATADKPDDELEVYTEEEVEAELAWYLLMKLVHKSMGRVCSSHRNNGRDVEMQEDGGGEDEESRKRSERRRAMAREVRAGEEELCRAAFKRVLNVTGACGARSIARESNMTVKQLNAAAAKHAPHDDDLADDAGGAGRSGPAKKARRA